MNAAPMLSQHSLRRFRNGSAANRLHEKPRPAIVTEVSHEFAAALLSSLSAKEAVRRPGRLAAIAAAQLHVRVYHLSVGGWTEDESFSGR